MQIQSLPSPLAMDVESSFKGRTFAAIGSDAIRPWNDDKDQSSWRSLGVRTIIVHGGASVRRWNFSHAIHGPTIPAVRLHVSSTRRNRRCFHTSPCTLHLRGTTQAFHDHHLHRRRNSLDRGWPSFFARKRDEDDVDDGGEAQRIACERMDEARRACAGSWDEGKDVEGPATHQKRRRRARPTPGKCWCSCSGRIHLRGRR